MIDCSKLEYEERRVGPDFRGAGARRPSRGAAGSQYTEARGAEYAILLPDLNRTFLGCIDAKFSDSGVIF